MTTRREALLALPLICGQSIVCAQAPTGMAPRRMGEFAIWPDSPTPREHRPLYVALREKGWTLGQNLTIEPAYANWNAAQLDALAQELVRKKVDVIVCWSDAPSVAAARATRTIPIVFNNGFFVVELGVVDSDSRPGRNATGLGFYAGLDVAFKRLGFLRELVPTARRLSWVFGEAAETVAGVRFDQAAVLRPPAESLGFETRFHLFSAPQQVEAVFEEIIAWRAEVVMAIGAPVFVARKRFAELLLRNGLPSAFVSRENVQAGGLLSYGPGPPDAKYRQARFVDYLDRVLRGTPPAELPVERPRRYDFALNLKTAKSLDLAVPRSMILSADELIQ